MEEKEDFSYGVIPIYRQDDEWLVLLVHQISYRGDDFWILPKGHAEEGESPNEAALRELSEETGINEVELIEEPTFSISYSFVHEREKIHKTVTYYVGICGSKKTNITQPEEIKALEWVPYEEAKKRVTHKNSVHLLEDAKELLNSLV